MRKRSRGSRRESGVTNIIEFGPTMWIVFIMITFPLLAFGTIGLRYAFVNNAVQYAAEAAAQSNTFLANSDASHLSAINAANNVISNSASGWTGISVNSVTTSIVIGPYGGGAVTTQTTPLSNAQMQLQNSNLYTCEVRVNASIQPLFPQRYFTNTLAAVPGLNVPIVTMVSSQRVFETPSGLNR